MEIHLCKCGCGQQTKLYKGKINTFINGHNGRGEPRSEETKNRSRKPHRKIYLVDDGKEKVICECGCGQVFSAHKRTNGTREYVRFINGHNNNRKGAVTSVAQKKKISDSMKGIIRTPEHRKNLSISQSGIKSHCWKDGRTSVNQTIRHSIETTLWREAVFARDNWTCQKCGVRGTQLHPHHKKHFAKFPELRFAIDNGITLCVLCHAGEHEDVSFFKGLRVKVSKPSLTIAIHGG